MLLLLVCALPVHITYARSSHALYQSAKLPQAKMQSTGMSIRPINTTPTLNSFANGYNSSNASLPARTISAQNFADLQGTGGGTTTSGTPLKPHVRRVSGEDDDDDPNNPYIDGNYTPIGDALIPLLIMVLIFCFVRKRSRLNES